MIKNHLYFNNGKKKLKGKLRENEAVSNTIKSKHLIMFQKFDCK